VFTLNSAAFNEDYADNAEVLWMAERYANIHAFSEDFEFNADELWAIER
jgi:hypothetical protein